jgi:hypothetical protein
VKTLEFLRVLAGQAGFEPATLGFGVRCSGQLELLTRPSAKDSAKSIELTKLPYPALKGLCKLTGNRPRHLTYLN